jgi:hypothetical protein
VFRPWNTFLKAVFPCQGLRRLIHDTELKPAAGLDAFRIEEFIGRRRLKVRIGKGRTLVLRLEGGLLVRIRNRFVWCDCQRGSDGTPAANQRYGAEAPSLSLDRAYGTTKVEPLRTAACSSHICSLFAQLLALRTSAGSSHICVLSVHLHAR